jgi:signal transduction histidine kinase
MTWDLRSFMPNRISGQIALIIIASLAVIHGVLTATFFLVRPDHRPERPPDQVAVLVELIDTSSPSERPLLVADIAKAFPQLDIVLAQSAPEAAPANGNDRLLNGIRHRLGPDYRVTASVAAPPANDGTTPLVAIRLRDGQVLTARMAPMPPPPMLFGPVAVTLLFIATSITLLGLWAARGLTRPLRNFARVAENFRPNGEIALLPERGPYEIRTAAKALNQMRERIKNLVDERTRMLAAVSHDLRTPITRLRLRCEFIENAALRAPTLDDLNRMNAMIENVLNFLRDGHARKPATAIDLASGLQTICDQFTDMGHDVTYEGPDRVVVCAHHDDLHRAITNLVDNAARYGAKTVVRLMVDPSAVTVLIEDDGPGIRDADKEAMFQPFARGDAARGMSEGNGFGLGLSIARTEVEAHGGTLELRDRTPAGLVATIRLPHAVSDAVA